jgi:uncharacterized protein
MPFHVMLIPTLGCPSKCSYCWSSDPDSPKMSIDTIKEVVEWLKEFRPGEAVTFTFHGGEPLLAGADFYKKALAMLSKGLKDRKIAFAMQSNLWLMTPEIAKVLAKYNIPIGSSLDGPKKLNDLQRSEGYYDRTMKGYRIARDNGLDVKFICTFTSDSVKKKEEIFNYFLKNDLTLKLHPALPSLRSAEPEKWALDPEEYGELLVYLLDKYLENIGKIEVMNIDHICKCIITGHGTVCTYVDCMDDTFAIGPDGSIYPCYRFIGMPAYVMGNVHDHPTMGDLKKSKAGKLMQQYKKFVDKKCGECAHIDYCRGGCPYNAIAPYDGKIVDVDPHCVAYKRIFDEVLERYNNELFGGGVGLEHATFESMARAPKHGIMSIMLKEI